MKKKIVLVIFALLISMLANTSCAKETDAYVGMSQDEFVALVPPEEWHDTYLNYIFYFDENNQPIVAHLDFNRHTVEEVEVLPDGNPSLRKFNKLREDTTPIEAFELLGMPNEIVGSPQAVLYETKSGEHVRIYWHGNGDGKTIVLSWEVYEPNR